jgi:uncharacterized protein (DUF305 family)
MSAFHRGANVRAALAFGEGIVPDREAGNREIAMAKIMQVAVAAAVALLALDVSATFAQPAAPDAPDQAFLAQNRPVMDRMMAAMDIKPSHDVDRDFVAMMVPHHQGAVDMAVLELRYGKNERLRRIAQEIIVDQQQEIAAMRLALGQPLPPSAPAPTGGAPPMGTMDMSGGLGR